MKNPRKIQKGSESMNEKDEKKAPQTFSVRTDLAIEARELAQKDTTDTLEGVAVETDEQADYSLTHVHILSPAGSERMGKPMGHYITLESEKLKENERVYVIYQNTDGYDFNLLRFQIAPIRTNLLWEWSLGKPYSETDYFTYNISKETWVKKLIKENYNYVYFAKVDDQFMNKYGSLFIDKSKEEFDKLNEALFESSANANKYGNMMGPVIGNIGNLQFVLTAVLGGLLSVTGVGGITLGVMASYLQFTKSFTQPFMQVAQQFNSIVMALAGADRIFALIDEKPETDEGYVTLVNAKRDASGNIIECKEHTGMWAWKHPHSADGSVSYTPLTGDVRFEDVTFGYNPDKVILKDISLFAKPGQKLAFVGSTGAGKTTITNLINRFYDIQEGKIRYDGINITKIKKDDLRRSLGIVLQDTHLFTGTIRDNIRYGNLDATDEQIYEAARLAHADQFIRMLPNGYDTMLSGDGEELSQGQRQLLSIARAAVADPPVLILDEATSSIDTRTESIVQKGMDNLMKGRTVFVIAHRLSTIRNSDAIIVLDHGQIIERGDHADLIKQKGTYYQLYTGKLELS